MVTLRHLLASDQRVGMGEKQQNQKLLNSNWKQRGQGEVNKETGIIILNYFWIFTGFFFSASYGSLQKTKSEKEQLPLDMRW